MSHYGNYKPDFWQTQNKAHTGRFKSWMGKVSSQSKIIVLVAFLALIFGFILSGCRTHQPTIVEKEKIVYVHSDSVRYIDSTVVIPIERYVDIVPIYDTLVLENSISISHSWVDTTNHLLRGELKNKNAIQYQVKYVERVVTNDSIVKVDRPIPYEVEVVKTKIPTVFWITFFICIGLLVYVGVRLYLKFYKPI